MEPEFIREPNFDVIGIGMEFLIPPIAYRTLDRKLLKIQWHRAKSPITCRKPIRVSGSRPSRPHSTRRMAKR